MAEFRMPALGADMEAGTLVAWRRKPGESLARGDVIAEVETDKGVIEVEVFDAGVLERCLVQPGERVPVGTPLAILAEPTSPPTAAATVSVAPATAAASPPKHDASAGERAAEARADLRASPAEPRVDAALPRTAAVEPLPALPHIPQPPSLRRRARELDMKPNALLALALQAEQAADAGPPLSGAVRVPAEPSRPRSSPAARQRARELGLGLLGIRGSGPAGAIVLADVERLAGQASHAPPSASVDVPEQSAQARLRRAIGAAMARSKREIPHYYLSTTIDFGRAASWLAARNQESSVRERILPAALLLKAVARAARQLPDFNAVWRDGALERPADINLGVAVALRGGGLIAPAIQRADTLSLPELMQRMSDLVQRARAGTLRSSELSSGTITVTSLGERGVETVFPIIYAPQTAIVGFGKIAERPWVVKGALEVRPLVSASLAADHRVTDGHAGARMLNLIDSLLQEPEQL